MMLSWVLLLCFCYFSWTTGLQCYRCAYLATVEHGRGVCPSKELDKSCSNERVPKSDRKVTCGSEVSSHEWYCGKMNINGTMLNKKVRLIVRDCFERTKCADEFLGNRMNAIKLPDEVRAAFNNFPKNFSTVLLSCNWDGCNAAVLHVLKYELWIVAIIIYAFQVNSLF